MTVGINQLPNELLQQANDELVQQLNIVMGELLTRSLPVFSSMNTVINELGARAEKGDVQAKKALGQFFDSFDKARAAAKGITLLK